MYFASPTQGQRFYLRLLLTAVPGATSFEFLQTFEDRLYPTFKDACLAQGLLENDGEWEQCLDEASATKTGSALRSLFAVILIYCEPSEPEKLWEKFRVYICDDLR